MQDDFDADGYEPEHDQYLDNDEESSPLFADEGDFDDEEDASGDRDELDPDDEEVSDEDYDSPHWDDL
ncbi:DNA-directed RNA polymerase I largest subunit [Pseudomonas sp. OF001]|uniref:hypothetical protein n=1 Tax=Pseudomonas sp. OF001 TaxID=2772300 RepID=UPI001919EE38|nr:hypothetical protein [Pseudomonas sp. OF001]CAD5377820.1 DNA-directed RNA polymerase I largest subunit [Pseudomonas sp. OF001]